MYTIKYDNFFKELVIEKINKYVQETRGIGGKPVVIVITSCVTA
jgi:hypothetical protein